MDVSLAFRRLGGVHECMSVSRNVHTYAGSGATASSAMAVYRRPGGSGLLLSAHALVTRARTLCAAVVEARGCVAKALLHSIMAIALLCER